MVHENTQIIRPATKDDLLKVFEMVEAALIEVGAPYTKKHIVDKVTYSYYLAPCFLLEIDGNICGMAGLTVVICSWSGNATLADYMFYIEPQYRSLSNLGGLVEKSKEFALQNQTPLRLEFVTGSEEVRKRLFRMHGFKVDCVVGTYGKK